jgi:hypothetical protein
MAGISTALPGRYAKFLTAAAGIGIVYAQNQFGASNQWVQLAVAIGAALGVLAVPNTPAPVTLIPGSTPWAWTPASGPAEPPVPLPLPPPVPLVPRADVSRSADPPMDHLAPPVT